MSLWASYQRHGEAPATRQELADELSGNLCRCTGYRPILDAGQRMFQAPRVGFDAAPVVEALKTLAADEPLALPNGFHAPRTVDAFAALLVENPQAKVLAGSTDMGLWVTKQFRALPELISINEVAELKAVKVGDTAIEIGAAASLEAAWRALVGEWPSLRDLWLRFASLPIREAGTMGGNVANGSPIGDSAPVLMALGATIVLRRGTRVRRLPLEDFYLDYMKNALEPGEFVLGLEVPRGTQRLVRAYKISKRFDCDISALCLGASLAIDGDRITAPRLAFGGMAAIVKRASKAEAALNGQPWNEASLAAAQAALAEDFKPLTDMRASAGYRLQVAQNLLKRLWLETRPQGALPDSATSVWAREELA
jgi:xanthine dehydrogenase small subunit